MTTPVTQSTKISMTTPVTQSNENGVKVMQFYLPSNFTKKNAPAPSDKELKLIIIEQGYYAVIKYSGRLTDKNFDKRRKILKNNLLKAFPLHAPSFLFHQKFLIFFLHLLNQFEKF